MKISVILTTILIAQVSASFFDVFQGAVLSVQNSFGKLLSDVVTDVKETVDCTILAVEHVLSLSHDATTRYYHKCGSETNKTDSVSDAPQDASLPKVEVTLNLPNNEEYLQKVIPAEIDARINETLSKVLGNFKPHNNVQNIENVLAKESEQLSDVSVLVKKELEKLSNEVTTDLKKMEKQKNSEPSIDTILQEIKVLEKREQSSKNTSEANEIHQVIDQVLGKLDAIEATEATENFKLEEILKDLESNSNNSLVGLRHKLEEWKEDELRHLNEIKSQIEEHEKFIDHPGPYNRHEPNDTQPVIFSTNMTKDEIDKNGNPQDIYNYNTSQVKETLDNSTRTIADGNDKSLLVANSTSSSQSYTFRELNDTGITSTTYSSIEIPLERVIIHPFAYKFSELTTLSETIKDNITRDNLNVTNKVLEVISRIPVNETIQPDESIPNSNKSNFLPINEDNKTIIISTATLATTDTPLSASGREELTNLFAKNNAVVANTAQYTESILTLTTLSKDSANVSTKSGMMVENAPVYASNFENEAVTTPAYIGSTVTMTPSVAISLDVSKLVTETVLSIAPSKPTVDKEFSTVTRKIVSVSDSNDTKLPSSSTILENTSIIENVPPNQTAMTYDGDQSESSIKMKNNVSDDTLITSPSLPPVENSSFGTENSSIFTTKIIDVNELSNTVASTSLIAPLSKAIQPEETATTGNGVSTVAITESTITSTTRNGFDSDTTLISTPIPTISATNSNKIQATSSVNKESSTTTTKIVNGNYSNNAMITPDPSLILDTTTVSKILEPEEHTTASDNEQSNITLKTTTSSTIESIPVSETIKPEENVRTNKSTTADNDDSTEAIIVSTATSITDNDSETTITSTLTTIISTSESDTIQAVDTTTLSTREEEYSSSTANKLTESISKENILEPEEVEPLLSNTSPPKISPAMLMDTDSNSDDIIRSTPFPISKMTTVSEITDLVESTAITEDEEPSIFITSPAPERDKVTIGNNDSIVTVTSKTENTDSAVVSEIIQRVETTTASEVQELSLTSTWLAINKMVTSSAFPPTESVAFKNEDDLSKPPGLEANTSRAPELFNNPNPTINPPVNRERWTPNKLNEPNYNTAEEQRNNHEFNSPTSLSDRLLQRRSPPFINTEVPMNDQAVMPPITRGLFNNAPEWLPPNRLIPDFPSHPRKTVIDTAHERLSDSPFGTEKENSRDIPSQHPIRPPYTFDAENNDRQLSLTTHRPARTNANANNYKNPSFDYDSFFRARDPEAHKRALKEARQLMANSKRSDRIINNIMKNKNKFNARSIFG